MDYLCFYLYGITVHLMIEYNLTVGNYILIRLLKDQQ